MSTLREETGTSEQVEQSVHEGTADSKGADEAPEAAEGHAEHNPRAFDSVSPVADSSDAARPTDDQILIQHNTIREAEAKKVAYIGDVEPLDALKAEYELGSQVFVTKIEALEGQYGSMRRARGDGNCFFRSFIFAYLEHLQITQAKAEADRFQTHLQGWCSTRLSDAGFQPVVFEDALELLSQQAGALCAPAGAASLTREQLLLNFRDDSLSNYAVMFLRLLASAEVQLRADFFAPFIMGLYDELYTSVPEFCRKNVEVMGEESDHVHIVALTEALRVPVRVLYLDSSSSLSGTNHHDFVPESCLSSTMQPPPVHLLYRPGHYDILYPLTAT